jgi:predicted phage terminase large subunit-like protein
MCTYSDTFASFWGRKARNFIADYGEEIGLELRKDSKASDEWENTEGGGMLTAGLRGGVTGRGTTCMVIDDAVKDEIEASSETIRETIWNQWQSTAFTRIEPGGCCVAIGTRWHEDDLLGRLEAQSESGEGLDWDIVNLPAMAEEDDPMGRDIGEPLWPQKRSLEYLEDKRLGMSPYLWGALYQGHPTPEGGGAIKRAWWKTWDVLPDHFDQVIMSWDLAFKDLKKSDYTVGAVWARKEASFYLLDLVRDRLDAPATMSAFRSLCAKWPAATFKMIEDAANGPAVFQMLRHEIPGVVLWPPKGQRRSSKDERISSVAPLIQAGNVYLPSPEVCPWVHDFIEEHAAFPHGANDDQVDTTSQALGYLRSGAAVAISRSWDDAIVGMGAPKTTHEIVARQFNDALQKKRDRHQKQFDRNVANNIFTRRRLGNW